jgi:hypothetical protein
MGGCLTRSWTSAAGVENLKTMGESFWRVKERMWSQSSGGIPLKGWDESLEYRLVVFEREVGAYALRLVPCPPSTLFYTNFVLSH